MTQNANNLSLIQGQMGEYATTWSQYFGDKDQTSLFRSIVPETPTDFTGLFQENHLDKFFTGERLSTKMLGPWNCNHLYRDSHNVPAIILFNNEKFSILHPLGEPGRDLGESHSLKITHIMCVPHAAKGLILFNQMLPSTKEETDDLGEQIAFMKSSFSNLQKNTPVSQCGDKVIIQAQEMGFSLESGIREFFSHQIATMTPEFRSGRPGYILNNSENTDIAGSPCCHQALIDESFTDQTTNPFLAIQGPNNNTQILTHIHGFLLPPGDLPEALGMNYINAELILQTKTELHGDATLTRTSTPPIEKNAGCSGLCPTMLQFEPEPEPETDLGAPLMRTSTPPIQRMDARDEEQGLSRTKTTAA